MSVLEKFQAMIAGTTATPLHWKSAILLVKLLQTKQCNLGATLPTIDGDAVTLQDILDSRTENVTRRNGTVGTDYLLTHKLESEAASQLIEVLKKASPKANSGYAGKGKKAANSANAETFTKDEVLQLVAELMKNNGAIAPTVAEGHTIPAEPENIAEEIAIDVTVGDVLRINGKLVQIVERANGTFGLNKTIV